MAKDSNKETTIAKSDPAAIAKNSIYAVLTNEKTLQAIKDSLPELGVTPQRVSSVAFSVISRSPALLACDARSLVRVIIEGSLLGLSFDPHLKQAAIVPFKIQGKYEAVLIVEYMGLVKLARNSGVLRTVGAEIVYGKDQFDYSLGLEPTLIHKPAMGERGSPIGVYAVGVLTSGDRVFKFLSEKEVNFYRAKSRAADSADSPWNTDPDSMWRKTAIRRLCGYLPMDDKTQRAIHDDEMLETGERQLLAPEIFDGVIDVMPEPPPKSKTEEQKEKLKKAQPQKSESALPAGELEPETTPEPTLAVATGGNGQEPPDDESEAEQKLRYNEAFAVLSGAARSEAEADILVSEATGGKVQSVRALKKDGTIAQMKQVVMHARITMAEK